MALLEALQGSQSSPVFKISVIPERLEAALRIGDPARWRALLNQHQHHVLGITGKRTRLRVTAVAKPQIDTKHYAKAILRSLEDQPPRPRSSTPAASSPDRTVSRDTPSSDATDLSERPAA